MSDAIANALPTYIPRTQGRVAFARPTETFTLIYTSLVNHRSQRAAVVRDWRGIWRIWRISLRFACKGFTVLDVGKCLTNSTTA